MADWSEKHASMGDLREDSRDVHRPTGAESGRIEQLEKEFRLLRAIAGDVLIFAQTRLSLEDRGKLGALVAGKYEDRVDSRQMPDIEELLDRCRSMRGAQ
jgi:hypothetical protein